ncbi:MAG: histidine--tRNA ligase [Candidatus Micrarchaeota archaeon]|nr:histidine--tRNA ligase [Candidatus Micrarchaeota archaeon]
MAGVKMTEMRVLKGTKDYLPDEQALREKIREDLVQTFRLYNFGPLETPILEYYDILASKYAGGEEILKETYTLGDQGERELGLRYDLTVPFSRVIAMNPNVKMPFKRWEMGKVFRDGPIKLGRYREFTQCDVDVVGIKSMAADAELVSMAVDAFERIGIPVYVEVNNMKLLSSILEVVGVEKSKVKNAILVVDKLKKIGPKGVKTELEEKGIEKIDFNLLFGLLEDGKTKEGALKRLEEKAVDKSGKEGAEELRELFKYLKRFDVDEIVRFVPSLARGLGFYTGTIFEVYAKDSKMSSSVAGGGRYDEIIGKFLESGKEYPAVGISFGLEAICDVIKGMPEGAVRISSGLKVYVISLEQMDKAIETVSMFRSAGIEADIGYSGRKLTKELDYANKIKVPYVIILGKEEVKAGKLQLRDMNTGEQSLVSLEEAVRKLK